MIKNDTNFNKMISDFDSFARDNGYVRTREWCAIKHLSSCIPNAMMNTGKINKFDYFRAGHVYYISIERDWYKNCDENFKAIVNNFEDYMRKHGYIRTAEYANRNFYSTSTVRNWYLRGILKFPDVVKIGEVYYMREDFDAHSKLKQRGPKPKKK